MNTPITIGISACLFGKNTRYDGGNLHAPLLVETLNQSATLIPLCPEAECGLGVPREPIRLEGDPENPRLMTVTTRSDLTDRMQDWCTRCLDTLSGQPLCGMILKARSPSCGKRVTVYGDGSQESGYSPGLFVRLIQDRFPTLPVADEEELRDSSFLADFLARITAEQQNKPENQR